MRIVLHERWKCIGCGACAAVAPDFWEMSDDGYADLKDCEREEVEEGVKETRKLKKEEEDENQNAADSCPAECIHVKDED
ncbi:ferredoxin [Candidatus Woesearchaeota archaeon]|nr:ferredoxin [Candidatus Woesearchaeota archaeon]|tara:strand:+ start:623 stop:862 length:240 start_codon:yes stop_codon:yes gene_type:complete